MSTGKWSPKLLRRLRFPETSVSSLFNSRYSETSFTKRRIINSADSDCHAICSCAFAVVLTNRRSRPFWRQKTSYNLKQELDVTGFTAQRTVSRKVSHSYNVTEYSMKTRKTNIVQSENIGSLINFPDVRVSKSCVCYPQWGPTKELLVNVLPGEWKDYRTIQDTHVNTTIRHHFITWLSRFS